jgi:hypothetical protein
VRVQERKESGVRKVGSGEEVGTDRDCEGG